MSERIYNILTVEDSEPDFLLLKKALLRIPELKMDIINVTNGQEAIEYVFKLGKFNDANTPDIIILDINLPIKNGLEVLKAIKNDSILRMIPTIMYTTSDDQQDITSSYALYANSYLTKVSDIKDMFNKISILGEFWLKTIKLPYVH